MKQIMERNSDGTIFRKYYVNNRGQKHGLFINYLYNHNLMYKSNWKNDELYGLETWYYINSEIEEQKTYLVLSLIGVKK